MPCEPLVTTKYALHCKSTPRPNKINLNYAIVSVVLIQHYLSVNRRTVCFPHIANNASM